MPTRYNVTVVAPGPTRPVLAVPFQPSATVSAFITELWKRIVKLGVKVEPNTHIVTLHLDSEDGAIIDADDMLDAVVDSEKDKLFATFKEGNVKQTSSTPQQGLAIRVITPELAYKREDVRPIHIQPSCTIRELHQQVSGHLGLPGTFDKPHLENECNCTLAKQLADGASPPTKVTVVHGKSIVQRLDIPEAATETVLNEILGATFGNDVTANKKINLYGAELHAAQRASNVSTYKKPPVVAVCSRHRHTPTQAKINYEDEDSTLRRTLDLHTSELPISRASFDATLADAGLQSLAEDDGTVSIYAVNRGIAESTISGYNGGHTYRYRRHWEPKVIQSDRGMAVFLSTMYVATKKVQEMDEQGQEAFYRVFHLMTHFPPALRAVQVLIEGKTPTAMESAAISHALYEVLASFMPAEIIGQGTSRAFEGTRDLFGFLFDQAHSTRLPEVTDDANLPYISSFNTIDLRDHKTAEPVMHAVNTQAGLMERDLMDALSDDGVLSGSHLGIVVEADTDETTKRVALLSAGVIGEVTIFSTAQLMSKYQAIYSDGGDADVVLDRSELTELHHLADLAGRYKLGAYKPSQLAATVSPCLTALGRKGHLAVYVGLLPCSGPGESTEIFRPKHGRETVNESTLEQIIEPIIAGYESDGTAVFDVHGGSLVKRASNPDEIVMVAVDCSSSMRERTDFLELQDQEVEINQVSEPTPESVIDPEFYTRTGFDDLKEQLSKHESFDDMTAIVGEARAGRGRHVAKDVLRLVQVQVGREIMQKHKDLQALRTVPGRGLYRVNALQATLNDRMAFWAGMKTHEEPLTDFLTYRANADRQVSTSWMWTPGDDVPTAGPSKRRTLQSLSEEITDVPNELMCPVSHALMESAVRASDGFTYSRQGITQWFAIRLSSPMHGLELNGRLLESNEGISQAVAHWIEGRELVATDGSPSMTLTFSSRVGQFQRKVRSSLTMLQLYQLVFRGLKARHLVFELAKGSTTLRPSNSSLATKGLRNGDGILARLADDDSLAVAGSGASSASTSEEHALVKVYDFGRVLCSYWIPRTTTKKMNSILWKFWRAYFHKYFALPHEEKVIWSDLNLTGDGFMTGSLCQDPNQQQLSRYLTPLHCFGKLVDEKVYLEEGEELGQLGQPGQPLVFKVMIQNWRPNTDRDTPRLSRLDVLKQMFDALINRLIAYSFKTHVGLVTFESNCRVHMTPSSTLENFRRATNNMKARGDTKLWDGLQLAKDQLLEYAEKFPNAKKRIVILSDGMDTKSTATSQEVAWDLFQKGVMLDSISLGDEPNLELKTISQILGCYRFHPTSVSNALAICELEPLLSITHRPEITATQSLPRNRLQFLSQFSYSRWLTSPTVVTPDVYPASKQHPNLQDEFIQLTAASGNSRSTSQPGRRSNKRIPRLMSEMKRIPTAGSHPKYDIYVSTSDIAFWKVVMEGPDDSPYAAGTFMLYLSAGDDYPYQPPEVRFVTKMMHPNISAHGRVCHSLLTGRDWTSDTSMATVLDTVFGLLLQAETSDPVNVTTTLGYHHDQVEFAEDVRAHAQRHASKTRQQWKEELIGEDENEEEDGDSQMEDVDSEFAEDDQSDGHFEDEDEDGMVY
ncbi:hypothetical protein M409DRAFT_61284 [Zasmidium cellare ATCC 36951]|uniref:peptidylprolyl isomerase n=1 Tax=Zasmidium cellare ATCC 36951 TaxID=1080233 RepID=A0A6A6BWA2_ZASCE|nr:uncharacterized protein M409DRAFT_61284 [Zasmidium cellare ATCC 36951]KAF2158863.1 hypothetical protein M409DRAFT_61284 [Zasmidium cellare ATCC 36951]